MITRQSAAWFILVSGLVVWLSVPMTALADAATRTFLVQRVGSAGVDKLVTQALEESLVLTLGQRSGVRVITPAELEQTLEVVKWSADLGCDVSEHCLAQLRERLAAKTLVASKVGKLGKDLFLTLSVVDVDKGGVQVRLSIQGEDLNQLKGQIPEVVDRILGKTAPKALFRLAPGQNLPLAVMPLSARGIADATADAMTQILSAELNQIDGVSVLSRDDIRAMLDKQQLEAEMGCTDNLDCIVEIGAALGLSKLVSGSVGKLDEAYVISLRLIDIRKAQVENRVLESFVGSANELKHAIKLSAYQLTGVDYQKRSGALKLSFNVKEADARVGGRSFAVRDSHLDVVALSPGRYSLQILPDPDRYEPLQTDLYVAPDTANIQTLNLREKPPRWYRTWWFSTATGAFVAGSGALTAYLLNRGEAANGSGTLTIMGGS